jgi:hypothetical protein
MRAKKKQEKKGTLYINYSLGCREKNPGEKNA